MPARILEILDLLRPALEAAALAAGAALYVDFSCKRRRLFPPGFRRPLRRALAFLLLASVFWVAIFPAFLILGTGVAAQSDFKGMSYADLFGLQMFLSFVILSWFALGFAVRPRPEPVAVAPVERNHEPELIQEPGQNVAAPEAGLLPVPDALSAELLAAPREVAAEAREIAWTDASGEGSLNSVSEDAMEAAAAEGASVEPPIGSTERTPDAAGLSIPPEPSPSFSEAGPPLVPPGPPPVPPTLGRQFAAQLGFRAPSPLSEIGFGLVAGLGIWFVVIAAMVVIALVIASAGGERFLPRQPPAMIPWIAGLPIGIRVLLSLSAGVVEETFFRGLLQPRVGIAFSTAAFVVAHAAYGSPFMLVGVTLLSLIYAFLVRWRQNLWPAIAAHALFDAIQLLVVIPATMRFMNG